MKYFLKPDQLTHKEYTDFLDWCFIFLSPLYLRLKEESDKYIDENKEKLMNLWQCKEPGLRAFDLHNRTYDCARALSNLLEERVKDDYSGKV